MRNKLFHYLIVLLLSLTICSCSDNDNHKRHNDEEDDTTEITREVNTRVHITPPDYLSPGELSYAEANNIEFSEQGSFGLYCTDQFTGETYQLPAHLRIDENTTDVEAGMKNVVVILTVDINNAGNFTYWTSAFDKYTGTSFEYQTGTNSIYEGCHIINTASVDLHINDYFYTIEINEDIVQTDNIAIITYTITCPAEYDGLVYQAGARPLSYIDSVYSFDSVHYADEFTDLTSDELNYFTLEALPLEIY